MCENGLSPEVFGIDTAGAPPPARAERVKLGNVESSLNLQLDLLEGLLLS